MLGSPPLVEHCAPHTGLWRYLHPTAAPEGSQSTGTCGQDRGQQVSLILCGRQHCLRKEKADMIDNHNYMTTTQEKVTSKLLDLTN